MPGLAEQTAERDLCPWVAFSPFSRSFCCIQHSRRATCLSYTLATVSPLRLCLCNRAG